MKKQRFCLIALGSNLASTTSEAFAICKHALRLLNHEGIRITDVSRFFRSPAYPPGSGPDFVNAVARAETDLPPNAVIAALHKAEAAAGRTRPARWAPRILDLDLIDHGGAILPDRETALGWRDLPPEDQKAHAPAQLILPHPRVLDRGFVLVPLREVAPDWTDPLGGQGIDALVAALPPAQLDLTPIGRLDLTTMAATAGEA
ncbi:2-amino-4-hydroxy-6-hydroxymethyldihydropteridine diphosphokinase [Oceanomicrobium pacificus]|uniref:2-amino-4-hydroxy-6-hydroxymethyldihydropteridine pyrophosphokinase n=1 Tax=Oceanomicrobium pacificus TaxID=2692916 RepID=A0A6B0TQ92_9RHOB|nr:2-amino-4-hydroxy-6-hydroxymethyldihydropteridine diphosphokinase [Oceanomicrobium pacificus]MXU63965.1 2-amino-4-hydroxy-6-hydroxymethyldihydropteridine diphosphokinase [Oceanomicrobium pacificus]